MTYPKFIKLHSELITLYGHQQRLSALPYSKQPHKTIQKNSRRIDALNSALILQLVEIKHKAKIFHNL